MLCFALGLHKPWGRLCAGLRLSPIYTRPSRSHMTLSYVSSLPLLRSSFCEIFLLLILLILNDFFCKATGYHSQVCLSQYLFITEHRRLGPCQCVDPARNSIRPIPVKAPHSLIHISDDITSSHLLFMCRMVIKSNSHSLNPPGVTEHCKLVVLDMITQAFLYWYLPAHPKGCA